MKNQIEITEDVLNGMIGIGGVPTNEEFYAEFNDRLKRALNIGNTDIGITYKPTIEDVKNAASRQINDLGYRVESIKIGGEQ